MTLSIGWPSVVAEWGTTPRERAEAFPCDELIDGPVIAAYRAVDVDAPPAVSYRWICQLRAAPYSYDWIDNRGRRSPQQLTPGLEALEPGQRMQLIFRIVAVVCGRSITMATAPGPLGQSACTYRVDPVGSDRSRIVVKIIVGYRPETVRGALMRILFPPGDLVMMRRQLLNLKGLAERSARGQ